MTYKSTSVFISCPNTLKIKGSCYSAPETTESNLIVPIKSTSLKIQKGRQTAVVG